MLIGLVGGWIDFETDWSRVPVGLADGLAELGVETRYLDATPYVPGAKYLQRWLPSSETDQGWMLRPEMIAIARASGAMRRLFSRTGDATGWVHLLSPIIGRPVRGRYVTFEDLTVAQMQKSRQWFKFSDRRFDRWRSLQADVYRHAKACCATSTWTKASIVEDFGVPESKVHVTGLGRNLTLPTVPNRDWSSPRFLFVGRDWPRKNGDAVVRCFARLVDEHPDARLDLVGGAEPEINQPGVFVHGHLDQRDPTEGALFRDLYAKATCFVMPSFAEPFAIAYLESASAGIPVIATTIGGIKDALGDGAFYVDPHDDEAIYRAMRRLCDPQVAKTMGETAERGARDYTWRNVAQRVLDAILD